MEQPAREDLPAAAAGHQELARDYDGAVAEGLIERIGPEIDQRVDARIGQHADRLASRPAGGPPRPAARPGWEVAVVSMTIGGITSAAVIHSNPGAGYVVVLIWIIIGIINVTYARRR